MPSYFPLAVVGLIVVFANSCSFLSLLSARPGSAQSHSRASSYQDASSFAPLSHSGLARANTTGGIPGVSSSGNISPGGRLSPFQSGRGGIPTIPTAQLSLTTDATPLGGNAQQVEPLSESDSEELIRYAVSCRICLLLEPHYLTQTTFLFS